MSSTLSTCFQGPVTPVDITAFISTHYMHHVHRGDKPAYIEPVTDREYLIERTLDEATRQLTAFSTFKAYILDVWPTYVPSIYIPADAQESAPEKFFADFYDTARMAQADPRRAHRVIVTHGATPAKPKRVVKLKPLTAALRKLTRSNRRTPEQIAEYVCDCGCISVSGWMSCQGEGVKEAWFELYSLGKAPQVVEDAWKILTSWYGDQQSLDE